MARVGCRATIVPMQGQLSPGNPAIWFEQHGTAFGLGMAAGLFALGYAGLTWIYRRQFYRRKLADPWKLKSWGKADH